MRTVFHGEVMVKPITQLPKGAKKKKVNGYQIIADSEVTGNHHVVDVADGVEFYEKDGKLYLEVEKEATVRCLVKERHDAVKIDKGVYEIDFQQEYDYLADNARRVAD